MLAIFSKSECNGIYLIVGSDTTTKEIKECKFDTDRKEADRCKESGQASRNEDMLLVSSH